MVPCFTNCPSEYKGEKDAWRQMARVKSGVGIVDGVDKYTGETLEAIARRASEAAKKDAELAPSPASPWTDPPSPKPGSCRGSRR